MPVFCGNCGTTRGLPFTSMRTARAACDFCGGFDTYKTRDRRNNIVEKNLPNYSYPDNLIVTPTEEAAEANE
jgi:hypothetical protein